MGDLRVQFKILLKQWKVQRATHAPAQLPRVRPAPQSPQHIETQNAQVARVENFEPEPELGEIVCAFVGIVRFPHADLGAVPLDGYVVAGIDSEHRYVRTHGRVPVPTLGLKLSARLDQERQVSSPDQLQSMAVPGAVAIAGARHAAIRR